MGCSFSLAADKERFSLSMDILDSAAVVALRSSSTTVGTVVGMACWVRGGGPAGACRTDCWKVTVFGGGGATDILLELL
jgi:hypothetical protein